VVGLLLGILEAVAQGYISGTWSNVIAFVVMLGVILMKPSDCSEPSCRGRPCRLRFTIICP